MSRSIVMLIAAALLAAALLAVPTASRADRRYYGETYNAVTAPKGTLDLELWTTYYEPPSKASGAPGLWRHQLELETGITDRWDVAVYGVARKVESADLQFEAVKLETRYALAAPGNLVRRSGRLLRGAEVLRGREAPLDRGGADPREGPRPPQRLPQRGRRAGVRERRGEAGVGVRARVLVGDRPRAPAGAELFGSAAEEEVSPGVEQTESQVWAGPAASIAFGRAWLVLAAGFGLTEESDALRARAILAFQF